VADDNGLVGMSVVAVCNGQIQDVFHTGQSDIKRNIMVNNNTVYKIASISKHVTSIGLMKLNEQGAFRLDDDVSKFLGYQLRNPLYQNIPITFRMILSHQSSIFQGSNYDKFLDASYN